MIIFDDLEYVKMIISRTAPDCINRNSILRSCAKMINLGYYSYSEIYDALQAYPKLAVTDILLDEYLLNQADRIAYKPHKVSYGLSEIKNISKLPKKSERKYYLYQLFLFKYFNVHRLRVSQREVKRLAGLNPNHMPIDDTHLGRGITIRREKQTATGAKILKKWDNNKPYMYYYPKEHPGKHILEFTYAGDSFIQPNIPFNSNLPDLWTLYLAAEELYILPKDKKKRHGKKQDEESI